MEMAPTTTPQNSLPENSPNNETMDIAGDKLSHEEMVKAAKEQCQRLDEEIDKLIDEGLSVDELEMHVKLLHEYNEIKDAAQEVLGKLALYDGVTAKELHLKYNLDVNE